MLNFLVMYKSYLCGFIFNYIFFIQSNLCTFSAAILPMILSLSLFPCFSPIWFLCSLCSLPRSALTSVIRCRIELRSLLINGSLDRLWQPQAEMQSFPWRKVTKYMYSNTVLKYNFDILVLCCCYFILLLHFKRNYYPFHSTVIWQLQFLFR